MLSAREAFEGGYDKVSEDRTLERDSICLLQHVINFYEAAGDVATPTLEQEIGLKIRSIR